MAAENDWFKDFQQANKDSASAKADTPAGSDRRKFSRFEVDEASTILYREGFLNFIGVGKSNKGRAALDLSTGGVRVTATERLAPGTRVRLRIQMEKYSDSIEAGGEVRWCHQDPGDPSRFQAGVSFTDLEGAQSRKIGLMREWFTSPQYKAVRATRGREKPPELEFNR